MAFRSADSLILRLTRRSLTDRAKASGGIGQAAATLFEAFRARIHAVTRGGQTARPVDAVDTLVGLDAVLAVADIVVVALPLTRETRGLIGARQLSGMKPDAILINVARAAILDEDALYDHLARHPGFRPAWTSGGRKGRRVGCPPPPPLPGPAQRHRVPAQLSEHVRLARQPGAPGGGQPGPGPPWPTRPPPRQPRRLHLVTQPAVSPAPVGRAPKRESPFTGGWSCRARRRLSRAR